MKNSLLAVTLFILVSGCATSPATPAGKVIGQCAECGTVQSIGLIEGTGQASGAGAIMGAVVGGVIGHQFGSGRGNDAATAAGAAGGAIAGHEAEKRRNSASYYRVTVLMDRGLTESVNIADPAGLRPGDRVRLLGRNIEIIR